MNSKVAKLINAKVKKLARHRRLPEAQLRKVVKRMYAMTPRNERADFFK